MKKRELMIKQLEANFPTKTTLIFSLMFIAIGLSAIGLQIVLIVNEAFNYKIANGIWGGFFAIFNGLFKLNMGKHQL